MGNCTDACANKGEQEEVLAAKNKEAGYMVGAANQGDLDVPPAHQHLLDGPDPAKPTLEKPPSFAGLPSQEPDDYYPMFSHQGPGATDPPEQRHPHPPSLRESNLHKSRVQPEAAPLPAPDANPSGGAGLNRSEQKLPDPLGRSGVERPPEKAAPQPSGLGQSQRNLGSSQQQPAQPQPAEAKQTTPQTSEIQYRDGFYSGEAEQGVPHGQGTFTNGNYTYMGAWAQGQMHGKCTIEE